MKIMVIFTGGTIGSAVNDGFISPDNSQGYKLITEYEKFSTRSNARQPVDLYTCMPYSLLSENLNGDYLINKEIFIEFLKFLIKSIQPQTKVVNIKTDLTKFLFFDEQDHLMQGQIDLKDEMGLITNLVLLAPRNINIHCSDKVSDKTFKTLYYLFDKKINLRV